MQHAFFHRLLQLLEQRPQQGKRMLGLEPEALWELWQRIAELERQERLQQVQRLQAASRWGTQERCTTAVPAAILDNASDC